MRKIISQVMVSLDGYIAGPNGELDWHNVDEEFNDYAIEFLNRADLLLFGRKTYEMMESYWPTALAMEDDPIVAEKMNTTKKTVVSTTLDRLQWDHSTLIKEEVPQALTRLKQEPGKNIAVLGSSELLLTLAENDLIDEYRIFIVPVVLGGGKPLLAGTREKFNFKLVSTRLFDSGNMLMVYEKK